MKKLFTSFIALSVAMTMNAQDASSWAPGQEITEDLTWQNTKYTGDQTGWLKTDNANVGWFYDESKSASGSIEMFQNEVGAEIYQVMWLPAGYYQFSVQGFYRPGSASWDTKTDQNALFFCQAVTIDETENENGEIVVNYIEQREKSTYLRLITSDAVQSDEMVLSKEMCTAIGEADWQSDAGYKADGLQYYVPNSMWGSSLYFDKGLYDNNLKVVQPEDGYVRIGIRKSPQAIGGDWLIFNNLRAYYLSDAGEAAQLIIAQEEVAEQYHAVEDLENSYGGGLIYTLISDARMEFDELYSDIESLTMDECKDALAYISDLTEKAKQADEMVQNLNKLIPSMELLYNNTDYEGKNAFGEALNQAKELIDINYEAKEGQDFDYIIEQYNNLLTARFTYLLTQQPVNGAYDVSTVINHPFFCNNEYTPVYDSEKGYFVYSQEIEETWVNNIQEQSWKAVKAEHPDWVDIASDVDWTFNAEATGEWICNHNITDGWMGGIDNVNLQHGYTAVGAWSGSPTGGYQEMRQTITNLPKGYYSMSALFINAGEDPSRYNQYVYISPTAQPDDALMSKAYFTNPCTIWWNGASAESAHRWRSESWQTLTSDIIEVSDGTLTIGSRSNGFYAVTGFQLYYYGETPDFNTIIAPAIADVKDNIESLTFPGDQAAANAILSQIPENITSGEEYDKSMKLIAEAEEYIATAKAAEDKFNNETIGKFAELLDQYAEGTDESAILSTAYITAIGVGENETDTYKDADAVAVDYDAYIDYIAYTNAAKQYKNDEAVAKVLSEQIAYLTDNYANAAKLDELKAELAGPYNSALMAGIDGFDKASEDNPVDVSALIINPSFDNLNNGWMGEMTVDSLGTVERWNTNFDISQTIHSLPAGAYKVQVQAFYRDHGTVMDDNGQGAYNNFWYNLDEETGEWANPNVKLYANEAVANVASICSESFADRSHTQYVDKWVLSDEGDEQGNDVWVPHYVYQFKNEVTDEETGETRYEDLTEENVSNGYPWDSKVDDLDEITFYPNSLRGAQTRFAKSPSAYINEVTVMVEEGGSLTIGIRKDTLIDSDWMAMDNWKLFYLGKEAPTAIDSINDEATQTAIYSVGGVRQQNLKKGINILKQNDGTVRKVYIK